jgi:hypothetical protein
MRAFGPQKKQARRKSATRERRSSMSGRTLPQGLTAGKLESQFRHATWRQNFQELPKLK